MILSTDIPLLSVVRRCSPCFSCLGVSGNTRDLAQVSRVSSWVQAIPGISLDSLSNLDRDKVVRVVNIEHAIVKPSRNEGVQVYVESRMISLQGLRFRFS